MTCIIQTVLTLAQVAGVMLTCAILTAVLWKGYLRIASAERRFK